MRTCRFGASTRARPSIAEELIREDFRIGQERALRLQEMLQTESSLAAERMQELSDWLEANLPFNCEHVVPAILVRQGGSRCGATCITCSRAKWAATASAVTNRTSTSPISRKQSATNAASQKARRSSSRARPRGSAARATLYFLLRYPGQVNDVMPTLRSQPDSALCFNGTAITPCRSTSGIGTLRSSRSRGIGIH